MKKWIVVYCNILIPFVSACQKVDFQAAANETQKPNMQTDTQTDPPLMQTTHALANLNNAPVEDFLLWCDLRPEYSTGNGFMGIPYDMFSGAKGTFSRQIVIGYYWEWATFAETLPMVSVEIGCRYAFADRYQSPPELVNQHIAPTNLTFKSRDYAAAQKVFAAMQARGSYFAMSLRARRGPFNFVVNGVPINNPDAFNLSVESDVLIF